MLLSERSLNGSMRIFSDSRLSEETQAYAFRRRLEVSLDAVPLLELRFSPIGRAHTRPGCQREEQEGQGGPFRQATRRGGTHRRCRCRVGPFQRHDVLSVGVSPATLSDHRLIPLPCRRAPNRAGGIQDGAEAADRRARRHADREDPSPGCRSRRRILRLHRYASCLFSMNPPETADICYDVRPEKPQRRKGL